MKSTEIPLQKLIKPKIHSKEKHLSNTSSQTKRKLSSWMMIILVLGGGATLWKVFAPSSIPITKIQTPPPKPVETLVLKTGIGIRNVKLLGQVEAGERASISSQIDGTVQKVLVREGDLVTKGMTLAILDDADSRLALAEAQARLAQENSNLARLQVGTRLEIIAQRQAEVDTALARELEAQDNLTRIASLTREGALSQRALVEAKTSASAATSDRFRVEALLAEAQAGATKEEIEAQQGLVDAASAVVQQAQLGMQRTEIKAAFSGMVQLREVDPGDYLEVNDPVVALVNDRSLDIFLEVPESLSGQVAPGMKVDLTARALPNWQQSTAITAVVPTANTASRRQLVRVSLDRPPQGLLSGMGIGASLAMPIEDIETFIVPRDALIQRDNEWLIFTAVEGKAQQTKVKIVADMGTKVAIASPDLRPKQRLVLRGGDGLRNKTPIRVIE